MFAMNQESSLIGITINDLGKAIGRWWSHTVVTHQYHFYGCGGGSIFTYTVFHALEFKHYPN